MDEVRLHLAAFAAALKAKLEYRADFAVGVVTSMALQFAALSLLFVVFANTESLQGWSAREVVFLFGATAICLGLSELCFNHIWMLPQYVVAGELDRLLTYPVHTLSFFLVTRPELHAFGNLFTGGVFVTAALLSAHAPWYAWLLTPLWCVLGSLTYTSMLVVFGSLSFKLVGPYSHQLFVPHHLLQATRYPLSIYPRWLRYLLLVGVPLGAFHFLPASFVFGKTHVLAAVFAPWAVALVAVFLARGAWRLGLRSYESTGS